MTHLQSWAAPTYERLADRLAGSPADRDAPSLCDGCLVRHVVAHVTMPVRLTPAQFGEEMAAARSDFTVLSDTVAARDAALPTGRLLDQVVRGDSGALVTLLSGRTLPDGRSLPRR